MCGPRQGWFRRGGSPGAWGVTLVGGPGMGPGGGTLARRAGAVRFPAGGGALGGRGGAGGFRGGCDRPRLWGRGWRVAVFGRVRGPRGLGWGTCGRRAGRAGGRRRRR